MKINVNGVEFIIKEVSQKEYREYRKLENEMTCCQDKEENDGIYFGATHFYKDIIFLDKELPIDRKKKTLIHELAHCYIGNYITHENKNYDEEMVADICANSYDFINDIVKKLDTVDKLRNIKDGYFYVLNNQLFYSFIFYQSL